MAADGGLAAPPRPDGAAAAWDEAAQRDPGAAALREKAEQDAAEQAVRVEELTVGTVIDDVLEVILQAEADGVPYEEIQGFLDDYLQGRWGDAASPLLQTIFRTNVQTAFNALRFHRMAGDSTRPVWRFAAVVDTKTSSICLACNKTTLSKDNVWWATHWPPMHHRCRSTVVPLTAEEAAEAGGFTKLPSVNASVADGDGFGIAPEFTGDATEIVIED